MLRDLCICKTNPVTGRAFESLFHTAVLLAQPFIKSGKATASSNNKNSVIENTTQALCKFWIWPVHIQVTVHVYFINTILLKYNSAYNSLNSMFYL